MSKLEPGDVLSYSAGSSQTGPDGYRKLRPQANLLAAAGQRWPRLLDALEGRPPLVVNAYPATLGTFPFAISVDTYLSHRVLSRALQLGRREDLPVILAGQPLFVADALFRHEGAGLPLPRTLILALGGYLLPRSLQTTIEALVASGAGPLPVVQLYGAAEVDAACLIALERDADGDLVYYPRDSDVEVTLEGDDLLLSLRAPDGTLLEENFRTGDHARVKGAGFVIWNDVRRVSPDALSTLESWSTKDWQRRTGYLGRTRGHDALRIQLREGVEQRAPNETEFHEFARTFGSSWLSKPSWR